MKKIFLMILVGCMVSLVGCNGSNSNTESSGKEESLEQNGSKLESNYEPDVMKEFEIVDDSCEEVTYQVGGFEFYCPKVFKNEVNVKKTGLGFNLEKKDFNIITAYGEWESDEYSEKQISGKYIVLTLSPYQMVIDDKDKEVVSTVSLDNITELTKEGVLRFFSDRYYLLNMSKWVGVDAVFEKSENVTINGINMLKLEGYFTDTEGVDEDKPFYGYCMISEDSNGTRLPVYYIGFPGSDGTYEEVVNYMNTYINRVKQIQ